MQNNPLHYESLRKSCLVCFNGLNVSILFILFLYFLLPAQSRGQCTTPGTITVDGNPCDWPSVLSSNAVIAKTFIVDANNTNDDQFTTGSQDPDPVSEWGWSVGNTNDKGDITNAGAALIGCNLYFFGDRTAINGDAQIGFWFFLGGVAPASDFTFSGEHQVGDILVLSHFTNGGGAVNLEIYQWNGSGLTFLGTTSNAAVNSVDYPVPTYTDPVEGTWAYTPKSGTGYVTGSFFEGYLNICNLSSNYCFTSFLLETRNSQSVNASLQDFTAGQFDLKPRNPVAVPAARCGAGSITISATCNNTDVRWYTAPTGGSPITTNATYTVSGSSLTINNLTTTTTFYASCFNSQVNCESDRTPVTATINGIPGCSISGDNEICAGQNTSFTAAGGAAGATYSWTGPAGYTPTTGATISNLTLAGTYTVLVTNTTGCTSTCTRVLTVNPLPGCSISGDNEICVGENTSFTASGGAAGATYSWSGPAGFTPATGATISNLTIAGTYTVLITNTTGCTSTCSRTLTVNPLPGCSISGDNEICAGQNTSFTATGGAAGATYSWTGPAGFTPATGATISNLTVAGTYTVLITNTTGCTSTCTRVLTVNPLPVCSISGTNIICTGTSTSFTASGGAAGATYAWTGPAGFTPTTGATISNLTIAGTYTVLITNTTGCTSTCTRTLTVNPQLGCEITGTNEICTGNAASFTASGGGAGASYSWTGPAGFTPTTGATISNLTIAGTYTVFITGVTGCTSTCSRTLTVNPLPGCSISGDNEICAGENTSFTASGGAAGATYSWTGPAGFTPVTVATISNLAIAGTYTVLITNTTGCTSTCTRVLTVNPLPGCSISGTNIICTGTSTSFTASGGAAGATYAWTGPAGFTATGATISNLTIAGTYTVLITNPTGCISTCSRTLTVNAQPSCEITGVNVICPGSSASFTASGGGEGATYAWTGPAGFTPTTGATISNLTITGTYTVLVTGATGCTSTCTRTLSVNNVAPGTIAGDQTICFDDLIAPVPFTSTVDGSGSGTITYQWVSSTTGCNGPWTAIAGATGPTFGAFVLPLTQNLYYKRVTISTLAGVQCRDTSNCVAILSGPCGGPFPFPPACTYTQGYYGNKNGNSCDGENVYENPVELISYLLGITTDPVALNPLTVGRPGRSVTIPATTEGAIKLNSILPGGRAPNILPMGNCTITDMNCIGRYLTAQGKINNNLLSQTIVLSLNVRMNAGVLSGLPIESGWLTTRDLAGCGQDATAVECSTDVGAIRSIEMNQHVVDYLTDFGTQSADVSDLLDLANDLLGGTLIPGQLGANGNTVPSYADVNAAVDAINNAFDGCSLALGYFDCQKNCSNLLLPCVAPTLTTSTITANDAVQLKATAYPNPYSDVVNLRITSPVSGTATVEVYDATGTRLFTTARFVDANTATSVPVKGISSSVSLHYRVNIGSYKTTGTVLRLK